MEFFGASGKSGGFGVLWITFLRVLFSTVYLMKKLNNYVSFEYFLNFERRLGRSVSHEVS